MVHGEQRTHALAHRHSHSHARPISLAHGDGSTFTAHRRDCPALDFNGACADRCKGLGGLRSTSMSTATATDLTPRSPDSAQTRHRNHSVATRSFPSVFVETSRPRLARTVGTACWADSRLHCHGARRSRLRRRGGDLRRRSQTVAGIARTVDGEYAAFER